MAINDTSIEIYRSQNGEIELKVKLENDTIWLTQNQMAQLFGRDRTVIARHIGNVYKEGELSREVTCAFFAQVTPHGAMPGKTHTQQVPFYNLDMILSVGYRVNSKNATRFRQWATSVLKQYLVKGYAINQRRLDHYDELKGVVRLMSRAIALQEKV